MKSTLVGAVALVWTATSTLAQTSSADDLARRTIEHRAVGAVIWGTPAVNTDLMRQEMLTKTWIRSNGKLCGKKRFQVIYSINPRFGDAVIDVTSYPAHQNEDQEDDDHQA